MKLPAPLAAVLSRLSGVAAALAGAARGLAGRAGGAMAGLRRGGSRGGKASGAEPAGASAFAEEGFEDPFSGEELSPAVDAAPAAGGAKRRGGSGSSGARDALARLRALVAGNPRAAIARLRERGAGNPRAVLAGALSGLVVLVILILLLAMPGPGPGVERDAPAALHNTEYLRLLPLPGGAPGETPFPLAYERRTRYTEDEAAPFRPDPGALDPGELSRTRKAELEAIYDAVD